MYLPSAERIVTGDVAGAMTLSSLSPPPAETFGARGLVLRGLGAQEDKNSGKIRKRA